MNANDPEYRAFAQDIVWALAITRDMSKDENIAAVIRMAFRTSEMFWPAFEAEKQRLAKVAAAPPAAAPPTSTPNRTPGYKRKGPKGPKRNSEGEWSP